MCKSAPNPYYVQDPPPLTIGTDVGVDLMIWANAEISMNIIGASIPFLRALIHNVRNSVGDNNRPSMGGSYQCTDVVASRLRRMACQSDNGCGKSIFNDSMPKSNACGRIVTTSEAGESKERIMQVV
jgi:hypothetical protein